MSQGVVVIVVSRQSDWLTVDEESQRFYQPQALNKINTIKANANESWIRKSATHWMATMYLMQM